MTRRVPFDNFTKVLPSDGNSVKVDSSLLAEFEGRVPKELIDFWREYDLGSFGQGALWFFDPREILDETRRFDNAKTGIPFARNAFSDFFFVEGDAVFLTLVQPNRTSRSSPRIDIWGFSYFNSPEDTAAILKTDLRKQAQRALGPLERGECYGLKQAVALGGEEVVENLRKSNVTVYLDILAAIHAA